MPETAAAHLSERHAARRDQRADDECRLVPHAARRVLVDHATSDRGAEIDRVAAPHHRIGERERLGARQALEVHRHAERRELVVRYVAARIAEDELRQLLPAELLTVALALDQLRGTNHAAFSATKMTCLAVAWNGSASSGTSGARCARSIVAATKSRSDLCVGKDDVRLEIASLHARKMPLEPLAAVRLAEAQELALTGAPDEIPHLRHVRLEDRRCDEPSAGPEHARTLRNCTLEVGDVVQHPTREDAVEGSVLEGKLLHVAYLDVDTPCARELHHARRHVDRADVRAELLHKPLGRLPQPATDVEHASPASPRPRCRTRRRRDCRRRAAHGREPCVSQSAPHSRTPSRPGVDCRASWSQDRLPRDSP